MFNSDKYMLWKQMDEVRLQVLTAASMMAVFWIVAPCSECSSL
jgi:hypothetical protein